MLFSLKLIKNSNLKGVPLKSVLRPSSSTALQYDKDPGPSFVNPEVQRILKSLTNPSIDVIFQRRTVRDNSVSYKFMTTEELDNEYRNIIEKSEHMLQMPPIVKVKEPLADIISKDTALTGFDTAKFVFTDITYGLRFSDRKVVVRETDGTLKYAPDDIAKRVKQAYIPAPGRKIRVPKLFSDEKYLKACLAAGNYKYILDRLCVQFEPYEQEFHDISSTVYTEINAQKAFNTLKSTRHFGPMSFFLAWHKMIDDLLYDMIESDLLLNAVDLITLYGRLHNLSIESVQEKLPTTEDSKEKMFRELKKSMTTSQEIKDATEKLKIAIGKSPKELDIDEICLKFIEDFVKSHSLKKLQLNAAIQTVREQNLEKRQILNSIHASGATTTN